MPGRLEGSVALITGAARGMGVAEAELFVGEGARVAVADVLVDDGEAVVERLGDLQERQRQDPQARAARTN